MTDRSLSRPASRGPGSGAAWLTLGGLAAAFGLASCCALPLFLATLGLSAAWLTGVALLSETHRGVLMVIGATGLVGGAVLLWRGWRVAATCAPRGQRPSGWARVVTLVGLVIGVALLWAGYVYA